tara:strand:+ start:1020 stop:4067 length:3048 start_codon:yes stop_codon:yes gene_type:complete
LKEKFQIINASAGSGKTFKLASNVIVRILTGEEESYKKILALTFTNNSANEMKRRILEELKQISIEPRESLIFQSSGLSKLFTVSLIKGKAKKILNKILHNFSFFQVSTIDKFNHRLIRSFSNDLALSYDFDLVIEKDEFVDQLIDKFFNDLEKESFLSDLIIKYANDKHHNNKSWDVGFDLKKLLDIIWDENNYSFVSKKKMDKKSFNDMKKVLQSRLSKNLKTIQKISLKIEDKISSIDQSSFSFNALPKLLKQIQSFDLKKVNTDQVLKRLDNNTLIKKDKSNSDTTQLISEITTDIIEINSMIQAQKTYSNLYQNLTLNYLIYNIVNYSRKFQDENNLLLISDFNSLITENISDQPAPFIYEKIGTKYNNYFVDEFQDTSELQWKNLIPLTSHALTNEEINDDGGNLFLVGDPKQSIYRWRGAKPETFTSLKAANPFYIKPKTNKLGTNYRSFRNIVDFNNKFFQNNSKVLNIKAVDSIYGELDQNYLKKKNGGHLSITFINPANKDYNERSSEKVLEIIKQKKKQGFNLSDIAILCRTNKECNLISASLIDNNIKVNSEELLALSKSKEVLFLIDVIRLILNKNDLNAKKNLVKFISIKQLKNNKYEFIKKQMELPVSKIFEKLLNINYERVTSLELYSACEKIISSVSFLEDAKMQVSFLLDEIYNFSYSKNSFLQSFVDYWDIKKEKLKVNLIEETNAVKVLTIHKSKGLEFPIVVLPYFDFKLKKPDENIWVNFSEKEIIGNFLVKYNESLRFFNDSMNQRMKLYDDQMKLDNLNVMYVSLSRAILENHIICEEKELNEDSSGGLLKSYITKRFSQEKTFYKIGKSVYKPELSSKKLKKLKLIDPKSGKNHNSLNKYYNSDKRLSSNFGNIFHNIMSEIEYKHQSDYVINDYFNRGIINKKEKNQIKKSADLIMNNSCLQRFFSKKNIVYNEREVFIPPDKVIIPDKTVFTSKKDVFILDYKTGKRSKAHQNQIKTYIDALNSASYRVKGAFLVYVSSKIDVLEISI